MRRLLLLVSAIVLVDTMFFAALAPLLPHYQETLGLTKSGAGLLSATYAFGTIVGAFPAGLLASRIGVKSSVLAGLALIGATSVLFGLSTEVWQLDTTRFFQGIGSSLAWTGALAWLVDAAPRERRGALLGIAISAAVGGALLGPVLGGVALHLGSVGVFSGVAVLCAILAAASLRLPAAPPEPRQGFAALSAALRSPRVLVGSWLVLLPGLLYGIESVLAPLKLAALGVGSIGIPAVFLAAAAVESAVNPLAGRWSDRSGRLTPVRVGLAGGVVTTALLPLLGTAWPFALALVLCSVFYGLFWAPAMALLADGAEAAGLDHGMGFALMNLAWSPGHVIGAGAGGAVGQALSDALPWDVGAALCGVTLFATLRLRALRQEARSG